MSFLSSRWEWDEPVFEGQLRWISTTGVSSISSLIVFSTPRFLRFTQIIDCKFPIVARFDSHQLWNCLRFCVPLWREVMTCFWLSWARTPRKIWRSGQISTTRMGSSLGKTWWRSCWQVYGNNLWHLRPRTVPLKKKSDVSTPRRTLGAEAHQK